MCGERSQPKIEETIQKAAESGKGEPPKAKKVSIRSFVVSFLKKGRCLCPCCRPAQATIRWFAPSHKTLFSLFCTWVNRGRVGWRLTGIQAIPRGRAGTDSSNGPFPQAGWRASGRVSGSVPARALSPERNVGARAGPRLERGSGRRSPIAPAAGAVSSRLPQKRAAAAGRGEAGGRRAEGAGEGRGTAGRSWAGSGRRRAGKKGTWLLRRAVPSAARGEGAPGASDRDGALQPRAAAAARGRAAAACAPSGGP